MNPARHVGLVSRLVIFASTFALFVLGPNLTFASTKVDVAQVLPPQTANTCASLGVSDVKAYVYDNELHSFDISITDPSYVAIAGEVGENPIAFHYFSRWMNPDGTLRIHTDIYRTSLANDLPIHLTLLSAKNGVTCVANVSATIPHVPHVRPVSHIPVSGTLPTTRGGSTHPTGSHHVQGGKHQRPTGALNQPLSLASSSPMFVGALHSLGNSCTVGGSLKLWVILLVLYALFVLVLVLQAPEFFGTRTYEWNAALILVVFLALLAFWYLSAQCRAGPWVALIASLIGFLGLIAGLFEKATPTPPTLLLKDSAEKLKLREGSNGKIGENKI